MEWLNKALEWVQSPWAIIVLGGVIDLAMRLIKTDKPQSLMYKIADGLRLLSELLTKLSKLMDVYIQRLKEPVDKGPDQKPN